MKKKTVKGEVRKLFKNGTVVQACLPTYMVEKVGLVNGGHALIVQKNAGVEIPIKDGDIIIRALSITVE